MKADKLKLNPNQMELLWAERRIVSGTEMPPVTGGVALLLKSQARSVFGPV